MKFGAFVRWGRFWSVGDPGLIPTSNDTSLGAVAARACVWIAATTEESASPRRRTIIKAPSLFELALNIVCTIIAHGAWTRAVVRCQGGCVSGG